MRKALALLLAAIALSGSAPAQTYPDRPVRMVVPFTPAEPLDMMARLYAHRLSEIWGKPVVVENRVGATGTIGTSAAAKAPADGYTLLFTVDLPIVMAPALFKPPYDVKADLLPIALLADSMNALVAHASAGVGSLAELVALGKSHPGKLTFSSAGNGSAGHMCVEMLKSASGTNFTHVPYKGAAPAMNAVVAGEVSLFCGPLQPGLPHIRSGKLKALGVAGSVPSPHLPGVPPLSASYPGVVMNNWFGAFAPARTPAAVMQVLRRDFRRAFEDTEIAQKLAGVGLDPMWVEGRDFEAVIERDLAKWTRVVRETNIKAD